jgi:hypothetical protein
VEVAEPDHDRGREIAMLRGIATMNLSADDLAASLDRLVRHCLDILGRRG